LACFRYPHAAIAKPLVFVLERGSTLVIPTGCVHVIAAVKASVVVTMEARGQPSPSLTPFHL
jgi:hypothetical protein